MQKSFQTLLWCISFALVFLTCSFAQDSKMQKEKESSPFTDISTEKSNPTFNFDGGALLWDNFLTQSTSAIVAGEWGGLPPDSNQVLDADDFFIPSATTWTIDQIAATGFYSVVADAQSWGVAFYSDNAGVPDTLIQVETVTVAPGDPNPAGLLSNPVVLSGGGSGTTYWVSIYGIHSTATTLAEFRWNWYASEDPEILSEPYLRDDAGFFGGTAGWVTYTSLGLPQFNALMFQLFGTATGGCPVGPATNPSPSNGATNVLVSLGNVAWTNGAGTTANEVYFGEVGNLQLVYDGVAITSYAVAGPLNYSTDYAWEVVCKNDTCSGDPVETWTFTTEPDPGIITKFFDDFEANTDSLPAGWVVTNDGGTGVWGVYPNPNVPVWPNAYTLPCGAGCGKVLSADSDYWESGSNLLSTARIDQVFDATSYTVVTIEFDQDFNDFGGPDEGYVEVSNDGGTTWTIVWSQIGVDLRNTHEVVDISSIAAGYTFQVRFRSVQPFWDWWWTVDNVAIYNSGFIPVELTSFTTSVISGKVNLNWQTATETNNYGFEVERKTAGQEFTKVGFVGGYGTTTEVKSYSFADNSVTSGSYTYRLKQVDLDGTFEYSSEVEVDLAPASYSLAQNYPNPFNPSTKINFSLASDSKVTLKIFDVLGQEVITLINGNLSAGVHSQNFDAATLNSGVYFYTIEAVGVDPANGTGGTNFSSTKKMILTK